MPTFSMRYAMSTRQIPPPIAVGAELMDFVDFKWLMSGEGHWIDLDRLRDDRAYGCGCLALARDSASATLRAAGARLARLLGRAPD